MTWGNDYVGKFYGGEKQDNDYFTKRMETENHGKKNAQKLLLNVGSGRNKFRENRDGFVPHPPPRTA